MNSSLTYSPTLDIHQNYRNAYEASLAQWRVPYESRYIPTSFGQTHVLISGPEQAEPILLIHGAMYSSAMWFPNIAAFSSQYRIYAIDIIDDKNFSMLEKLPQNREEYAVWLQEVLDGLGLKQAKMVGLSYGGQLIVNLAIYAPAYVEKAVIMSPAETFVSFRQSFYKYAFGLATDPNGPDYFQRWLFGDRYEVPASFDQLFRAGIKRQDALASIKERTRVWPYVCTDEELQQIKQPLLVLFGEYEVMYDPEEAKMRALRHLPHAEVEIVEKAGHVLSMEQPAYVNERVLHFFKTR
ncbi:alpha/beta fold hydrolase [Brevibacillus migulae]|uniref:alpha/beta fold hydrolase n=1 Tax=Brevibacillus migulae TaxID=1644114 RepID=UPI00106E8F41|nr:alpha/beta hydrolase [Brevibacillus migulae]